MFILLTRWLPRALPVGRIPLIFGGLGSQRVKKDYKPPLHATMVVVVSNGNRTLP
jgi:hypothetical protein